MKITTAQLARDVIADLLASMTADEIANAQLIVARANGAIVSLEAEVKQAGKSIAMMLKHPNGLPSLHFVEGFGAAELSILPKVCSLYAAPQEPVAAGMDDENIANRLER